MDIYKKQNNTQQEVSFSKHLSGSWLAILEVSHLYEN